MTGALRFFVAGTPAAQGSKRYVGHGVMIESSKYVKPWREAVKAAALDETSGVQLFARGVPVWMSAVFFFRRPASHYRTGANAHLLRAGAPRWPAVRPDRDKLLRAVTDAITDAGVWWDDSQVVAGPTTKRYAATGCPTGALITLTHQAGA